MAIKHTKTSAVPDGPDAAQVQPSDWNADHSLPVSASRLLGNSTASSAEVAEVSLGSGLVFGTGSLELQIKTVNGDSLLGAGNLLISDLTNPVITGSITEGVFALTGTTPALEPDNGTIQTWTLTGNSTPTDGLSAGQSMTLMINDGTNYTITWPSVVWVGGTAPVLAATGQTVVELWKVGAVLYGALVGSVA